LVRYHRLLKLTTPLPKPIIKAEADQTQISSIQNMIAIASLLEKNPSPTKTKLQHGFSTIETIVFVSLTLPLNCV
jgi:hypothetical protein